MSEEIFPYSNSPVSPMLEKLDPRFHSYPPMPRRPDHFKPRVFNKPQPIAPVRKDSRIFDTPEPVRPQRVDEFIIGRERPDDSDNLQDPEFQEFLRERATFTSDLQRIYKFEYLFGLDEVKASNQLLNRNCCFVTKEVYIANNTEIKLRAKYISGENTSIEFYVVEDEKETGIIPEGDTIIKNEKLFPNSETRFPIDDSKEVIFRMNGEVIKADNINSYYNLVNQNSDKICSINYTPLQGYIYNPIVDKIKLKVILRIYEDIMAPPYVYCANFVGTGGNNIWIDQP